MTTIPLSSEAGGETTGLRAATTMRASVLGAPGQAAVEEVPRPEPQPREVRVRLEGCGVCASSIPLWEGRDWFSYPESPGTPGHEGWGVVDALGDDVRGLAVGDRVAALSFRSFAEYDVAPASAVIPLPSQLDGRPFPGEPLGCVMNIWARSDIRAGQDVTIVGIGFLGALLTQLAVDAGARVIAISRRPFSLELARRFGAHETMLMDDRASVVRRVAELTDGRKCSRVVEAVGQQEPLDLASELTAEGGRLVVAGYHQDGPRQVNMWLWNWRGIDVVNAHERDPRVVVNGMRAAVEATVSGRIDPWPLLTRRYALSEVGAALRDTRDRPDGFVKGWVDFT